MVVWTKIILSCGLPITALFASPLIPQAISQQSRTALTDVCALSTRYYCGMGVRLCVSPDVEKQYDLSKTEISWCNRGANGLPQPLLPDAWAHLSLEIVGYVEGAFPRWEGYNFHTRVVNFDSSMIKDGDVEKAAQKLQRDMHQETDSERDAYHAAKSLGHQTQQRMAEEIALDPSKIHLNAPEAQVKDVCPAQWSRFSCQFVRLCVSPSVAGRYDLASSDEFKYAHCKADNRSVPDEDTHFSPSDVGEGALLVNRVYFKKVKLDSSDIFEGDIEEAIERLVLVPIPPSGLMEYDSGYEKGRARFERSASKADQKQKQSDDAKTPH